MTDAQLSCTLVSQQDRTIMTLVGTLDYLAVTTVQEAHRNWLQNTPGIELAAHQFIIVMDEVSYLDAAGLGALVGVSKRIANVNASLTLVLQNEQLMKIFRFSGLARYFRIVPSLDDV